MFQAQRWLKKVLLTLFWDMLETITIDFLEKVQLWTVLPVANFGKIYLIYWICSGIRYWTLEGCLCILLHIRMKKQQYLFRTLFFITKKGRNAKSDWETQRDEDWWRLTKDSAAILAPYGDILRAFLLLLSCSLLDTQWLLSESARFSWLTACLVEVETVCLYDIHNAHAFHFRFLTHATRFCRSPVYTGASYLRNLWRVYQRSICNNICRVRVS